jgi:ArsR family transcriptional regulator
MMIDMLKAITDENRLKIVRTLSRGSICVCDIEKELKLPQNLVSHHLSVLKEANLVENCRCGKNNYYSLNKKSINKLVKELNKLGE